MLDECKLREEMSWEGLGLQELLEDREGHPCYGGVFWLIPPSGDEIRIVWSDVLVQVVV